MSDKARLPLIRSVEDFPYDQTPAQEADLQRAISRIEEFYKRSMSNDGIENQEQFKLVNHWASLLNNPIIALHLANLCDYLYNDVPWCQNAPVRELMVLMTYRKYKCEYGFRAHCLAAKVVGVTDDQVASLGFYRDAEVFTDEERMVLEFTEAACDGDVPDELFERARARYGDQAMFEIIATFSFYVQTAVILKLVKPPVDIHLGLDE